MVTFGLFGIVNCSSLSPSGVNTCGQSQVAAKLTISWDWRKRLLHIWPYTASTVGHSKGKIVKEQQSIACAATSVSVGHWSGVYICNSVLLAGLFLKGGQGQGSNHTQSFLFLTFIVLLFLFWIVSNGSLSWHKFKMTKWKFTSILPWSDANGVG